MVTAAGRHGNLPAEATSFVGRRWELGEVRRTLTQARLVSLVGPGGVGKTRLAIRASAELGRGFPDGAWLVELGDVGQGSFVGHAVLAALDLRDQSGTAPRELLLSYLEDKTTLLLLDNCEHLLADVASLVADIIKTAPDVRVLATSREPLSIPGEHVVPVPPLELPALEANDPLERLAQNEAVMLFVQRAEAATGTFRLTEQNKAVVVQLCRRLDGLPLAIELAAVRVRALSVEEILDRLTDRFSLLTQGHRAAVPRHQTLRTTIEWSHGLLGDGERVLLRRLSAFAGRFTLEDVENTCAFDGVGGAETLDLMASLVDKSLVVKSEMDGRSCFHLHETMREFAGLQLQQAGETDPVWGRRLEYYWSRIGGAAAESRFRLPDWLAWMDLEIDNVRAVLQQCAADGDSRRGADLASGLGWYWITRAITEGVRWLDDFFVMGGEDLSTHVRFHFMRGFLALLRWDPVQARPALAKAVETSRGAGPSRALVESLAMASIVESWTGEHDRAVTLLREAQGSCEQLDDLPARLAVLQARTMAGIFEGDLGEVVAAAGEEARLSREGNDLYALEMSLLNLGSAALFAGDVEGSKPLLAEALTIALDIDDRLAQFYLLDMIACGSVASGRAAEGAQLFGAAATVQRAAGANVMPFLESALAAYQAKAEAALGTQEYEAQLGAGRRLHREQAAAMALDRRPDAVTGPAHTDTGPLSKRELEVARLLAEGLTNKEIGSRLFISERTVDTHVRKILDKLGFNSRSQVAAWAGRQAAANEPE